MATGRAQAFVGDHGGAAMSKERMTQSRPPLTWGRARLELSGSWCMPVPKVVRPRPRASLSSTPRVIVPSGKKGDVAAAVREAPAGGDAEEGGEAGRGEDGSERE